MSDLLLDTCALLWLANGAEMTSECATGACKAKSPCIADQRLGGSQLGTQKPAGYHAAGGKLVPTDDWQDGRQNVAIEGRDIGEFVRVCRARHRTILPIASSSPQRARQT